MGIPKTIHYCWFGEKTKSELIQRCIDSWKKYAPDFNIVEWNETNFDINKYEYVKQAYNKQKYAFVSDVVRFDVLYRLGGIYLDTDVELLKPLDFLIEENIFFGYDQKEKIASGLIMGCIPEQKIIKEILDFYKKSSFLLPNGNPNMTTVVTIVSDILEKNGFKLDGTYYKRDGLTLYPAEYFDPYDVEKKKLSITEETVSIHHYAASWKSKKDMRIYAVGRFIRKIVGNKVYDKIARLKHKIMG